MRAWDAFRARRSRSPLRLVVVGGEKCRQRSLAGRLNTRP